MFLLLKRISVACIRDDSKKELEMGIKEGGKLPAKLSPLDRSS